MTDVSHIRLLHLCSSVLPVGAYAYSQGLEWAVEKQWISKEEELSAWLADLINTNLRLLEIPVLVRMVTACQEQDKPALSHWVDILLANRETSELRSEENNRGRAMGKLIENWGMGTTDAWQHIVMQSQTAGFATAVNHWKIPLQRAVYGFAWAWLENMVLAGIKLIPLGQMAGQRILENLIVPLANAVEDGLKTDNEDIGISSPAAAFASACHETQYTRLFRS